MQWILFLPVGYLLFTLSQFLVFISLSYFLFWVKGFSTFWLLVISLGLATPIFTIMIFILGGAAMGASYVSPKRIAYWVLAILYLALGFLSVFQYCSVGQIPETATGIIIQLPCWVYIVIYLLQAGIIISVGGMKNKEKAIENS